MNKRYELAETVISQEQLETRIKELGAQITKDYNGEPVVCVGILKGSIMFMADLVREMPGDVTIDFMSVSSYGAGTTSSGEIKIKKDLDRPVEGRHLLIVEDIIDSGNTLNTLKKYLSSRGALSVKIVTLLDKPARRKVDLTPDYVGFTIPDKFIVGFGLDVDEDYRNLPYIANVKDNGEEL